MPRDPLFSEYEQLIFASMITRPPVDTVLLDGQEARLLSNVIDMEARVYKPDITTYGPGSSETITVEDLKTPIMIFIPSDSTTA